MLRLVEATDAHWAWLCGEQANPGGWRLPEGGVDDLATLRCLRSATRDLRSAGSSHSYLIVQDSEIVGLCGYKCPPQPDGRVEIGFGIAAARRALGHATCAVALLLDHARRDETVCTVLAETRVDNIASQSVLLRNGFTVSGNRRDDEEGELILWSAPVLPPGETKSQSA